MTAKKIEAGNRIIAEFMGGKLTQSKVDGDYFYFTEHNYANKVWLNQLKYDSDWNWLIRACSEWSNQKYFNTKPFAHYLLNAENRTKFHYLEGALENKILRYEIEPVFVQLVKNIEFLNSIKK